jgi:hypothetical protein
MRKLLNRELLKADSPKKSFNRDEGDKGDTPMTFSFWLYPFYPLHPC